MSQKVSVALHTLGCKLNQAETETLAGQFIEAGYQLVAFGEEADVYIVNTCTVTHVADRKSRHLLRMARRRNPDALVVATGCYAQRSPQELAQIAQLVLNNEQKAHIVELVGEKLGFLSGAKGKFIFGVDGRVRALVKVQDGCDDFCSYCIVPRVRGRENCLPVDEVIEEVRARVAAGYREVVLTGTKIGSYSYDGVNLKQLVERILGETSVERLRLSSLQPQEISTGLISLWRDRRLCPHFHLALQSGNGSVLGRMRRRYCIDDYQRAMSLIKEAVPDAAITTDVIVGFPGESDSEFEDGYRFCGEAGFANMHVFPFSLRPGTLAARMPGQVEEGLRKERGHKMLELARRSVNRFRERFLGQTMEVLWEKETSLGSGVYSGLTGNYIRVFTKSDVSLTNRVVPVKLLEMRGQGVWGELTK